MAAKEKLLENVKRDSTEEKLDDFLEKSLEVRDVIVQQQFVLEMSDSRSIFRFVSRNGSIFFPVAFVTTLYINITLLMFAAEGNDKANSYLPPDVKRSVTYAGYVHVFMALLVLFYHTMGSGLVCVLRLFVWITTWYMFRRA